MQRKSISKWKIKVESVIYQYSQQLEEGGLQASTWGKSNNFGIHSNSTTQYPESTAY